MNKSYALSAVLSFAAAVIRTVDGLGGPLRAAHASALDENTIAFFYLTWHLVSAFFVATGIALLLLAFSRRSPAQVWLGRFIGTVFIVWSALIAATGVVFVWHAGIVVPMVVTLVIGALALAGTRHRARLL